MGRFSGRLGIGAGTLAAFFVAEAHAETTAEPSIAEAQPTVTAAPESVSAQTVSTVLPAQQSQPLFRHESYPDAWTAAQESNRPILLYVTMPGCPHCDKMMAESYRVPDMEQMISSSFETVYVSRQTNPRLVKSLKIRWFPTTVVVGTNNKIMDVIEGYVDVKTFQRRLETGLVAVDSSTQTR